MRKVVLSFSGGLDSSTALGALANEQSISEIHCCFFSYGSTHGAYEKKAAEAVIQHFTDSIPYITFHLHDFDITEVMKDFSSALLLTNNRDIPKGFYEEANMSATVVPGRNLIFTSILAGFAESIEATEVILGVHQGEHFIYPDCRPDFIKALERTIHLSSDGKVQVSAPFLNETKAGILRIGLSLKAPVPYHLTRSCYENQPISCGRCGTCLERIEAFKTIGERDPIQYQQ